MIWIIRSIKLDDIFFLIRERRRKGLAGAKARQGLGGVAAAQAAPNGLAVLAARRMNPAQLGRVPLEVALRGDPAHAGRRPLPAHAGARGRRDGRRRHDPLDLVARPPHASLLLLVVLPLCVLLGRDQLAVDLVQVHHRFPSSIGAKLGTRLLEFVRWQLY